jgi:hypothetical protein
VRGDDGIGVQVDAHGVVESRGWQDLVGAFLCAYDDLGLVMAFGSGLAVCAVGTFARSRRTADQPDSSARGSDAVIGCGRRSGFIFLC